MDLGPDAPFGSTMLAGVPLAFARDFDTRADSRCSGPLEPRFEMFTARVFWRRDRVLKSGTVRTRPTSCSRL